VCRPAVLHSVSPWRTSQISLVRSPVLGRSWRDASGSARAQSTDVGNASRCLHLANRLASSRISCADEPSPGGPQGPLMLCPSCSRALASDAVRCMYCESDLGDPTRTVLTEKRWIAELPQFPPGRVF